MSLAAQGARLGRLLRRLADEGSVDPVAALDGRIAVIDLSRSNPVGLIEVDGRPLLVVKGTTPSADGGDPIAGETAAYRWLRSSPATAALAPTPVLEAAPGLAVVTRPLADAVSLHEALACEPLGHDRLIGALGRALAILHGARAGPADLPARRPWILGVPAGDMPAIAVGNPAAAGIVGSIAACPPLAAAIAGLAGSWTCRAAIHGDIKFDNVLVTPAGIRLVDWELAGLGEPVWDLAGVVDGLLLPSCLAEDGAAPDRALVERLVEPALAGYRAIAGAGLLPTPDMLATAVAARLAQTAIQLAAMSHERPEASEAAPRMLDAAARLAGALPDQGNPARG